MSKKQPVVIDGREPMLSNLEKVFFPESGFTKGEMRWHSSNEPVPDICGTVRVRRCPNDRDVTDVVREA